MQLRFLLVIAFLGTLTFACSPKKSEVDGKQIYKQFCVTCHGLDGDMGVNGATALSKSTVPLSERVNQIRDGKNAMTPFKGLLSDEEIRAVAEYTMQLKKP